MKNKNVIYTSIIGDYDTLKDPGIINKGWDYICFTDTDKTSDIWEIRKIGLDPNLSNRKNARKIKILYHHYVGEYDISIHVPGCSFINIDLDTLTSLLEPPYDIVALNHPYSDCVFDEADMYIKATGDPGNRIKKQIDYYKQQGMPIKFGLTALGMLIRKTKDKNVQKHCELWWEEVQEYSPRDQISFAYILWKYNLINIKKWEFDNIWKSFLGKGLHNGKRRFLSKHSAD